MIKKIERMTATYKPRTYLTMQKEIATIEWRSKALYWCLGGLFLLCLFAVLGVSISIYQYITEGGNSDSFKNLGVIAALTTGLCLLLVSLLHHANFFAEQYFKKNYPYIDSRMITSCLTVRDLDDLFKSQISLDQYRKLKIISDKNEVFKNKIIEIKTARNGVITKLDYYLLNCEKIYAICINRKV